MKFNRFEEINAWKKARILTLHIFAMLQTNKNYGYNDQIQRASISIMNNIAEGFERQSNNEFKRFLYIAKGSSGEVRSMLYLGRELKMIDEVNFLNLYYLSLEISKMLSGLIKTL